MFFEKSIEIGNLSFYKHKFLFPKNLVLLTNFNLFIVSTSSNEIFYNTLYFSSVILIRKYPLGTAFS